MGMISIGSGVGVPFSPMLGPAGTFKSLTPVVLSVAGDYVSFVGKIHLTGGATSINFVKEDTFDLFFTTVGTFTFNDPSTIFKVGVTLPQSDGDTDLTFLASVNVVSGDISANGVMKVSPVIIDNFTINHGDMICIVITAEGIFAGDAVGIGMFNDTCIFPTSTISLNGNKSRGFAGPCAHIYDPISDTYGFFEGFGAVSITNNQSLLANSTPPEYALITTLPFDATIHSIFGRFGQLDGSDQLVMSLVTDPLNTGGYYESYTFSGGVAVYPFSGSELVYYPLDNPLTISKNTPFAVAFKQMAEGPDFTFDFMTRHADDRFAYTTLAADWYMGTRSTVDTAFDVVSDKLPFLGFTVSEIGAGGGEISMIFV